jgi:hypothetical protein
MNARMNAVSHDENAAVSLVELVDLKWLLAGEGVHLHVERLQRDLVYARRVLETAAASSNEALRRVAARVRAHLRIEPA